MISRTILVGLFTILVLVDIVVKADQAMAEEESAEVQPVNDAKATEIKSKRQFSPASRLQKILNEYRAAYDQLLKSKTLAAR